MTELTGAQWREIEAIASEYMLVTASGERIRAIPLGQLRTILRKSRRSNDQNALLWALYDDVLSQGGEMLAGWTKEDLHEYALGEHFGWQRHEAFGRVKMKPNRRSSRLNKTEFADFLDAFVRRMAEHGIVLQLPGELAA